jgi:hypothetical protein
MFITGKNNRYSASMKKAEMYRQLKEHPKNVRFEYLCTVAERYGFTCRGGKGSHRIYTRDGVRELLNFQEGMAKPYQVKQFCRVIEEYSLIRDDTDV